MVRQWSSTPNSVFTRLVQAMPRPFKPLRELDLEELAEAVVQHLSSLKVCWCLCCRSSLKKKAERLAASRNALCRQSIDRSSLSRWHALAEDRR